MTDLPKGWEEVSLAALAQGGLFTDGDWVESKDQDPSGLVRLTQLADVGEGEFRDRSDRWLNDEQAARLNVTFLQPNDLLIARMPDPLARCCMVPESIGRAVTVVDVAVLRIKRPDVLPRYLMWAINSPTFRARALELSSGTTRKRISRKNLAQLAIPLPPLDEQRRIVDILEDHLSRLDAAVETLDAVEVKARLLLASAFEACASPSQNNPSHEPWRTMRFGDIASIDADLRDPLGYMDWPHIAPNHIEKDTGRLLEFKTIGEDGVTSPKHAFRSGQILYSKIRPYLNKVALPNFEGLCSADMYPISTEQDVEWLHYAMLSPSFVRKTSGTQNRTVLPKINASALRAIVVMVPPAQQQVDLRLAASEVARAVERIGSSVAVARRRADNLRGALLRAAFSGQLTKESLSV